MPVADEVDADAEDSTAMRIAQFSDTRKELTDNLQWLKRKVRRTDPSRLHDVSEAVRNLVAKMRDAPDMP